MNIALFFFLPELKITRRHNFCFYFFNKDAAVKTFLFVMDVLSSLLKEYLLMKPLEFINL